MDSVYPAPVGLHGLLQFGSHFIRNGLLALESAVRPEQSIGPSRMEVLQIMILLLSFLSSIGPNVPAS